MDAVTGCPDEASQAGVAPSCQGCPGREYCQSNVSKSNLDSEKLKTRMGAIKHKILIVAGKGGVGKSSVASGVAIALAKKGLSVGLLDVDICGPSIPRLLNLQGHIVQDSPYGWIPPW